MGFFDAFHSLSAGINTKGDSRTEETQQGALDLLDDLKLNMSDEKLIALKKDYEKRWKEFEPQILRKQLESEDYWKGKHFHYKHEVGHSEEQDYQHRPQIDNLIFEALETFLPIATRQNPEPVVFADQTKEGQMLADKVRKMLIFQADRIRLKLRLKKVLRLWSLHFVGVMKVSWSERDDDMNFEVIRAPKLILDPDSTVNEDMEYTGEYIGIHRKETAANLVERFPEASTKIKEEVQDRMGTQVGYVEWWTNEFVFWTMKDEVLGKLKNPNWNQPEISKKVDEFGEESIETVQNNHFRSPKMPFIFLSVFNLGKTPFDETSLIEQNLTNQDIVNKRQRQIDQNVSEMNNSWVISGERSGLTKQQATEFIEEARIGGGLFIESGSPRDAVSKETGSPLPADVFNNLADMRNEIRNIFGTRGSSPQGTVNEETVRGKIIISEQDSSRIGGGISEYLEQFADKVFNWMVQMMYVHYDEAHVASMIGDQNATEFIQLSRNDFNGKRLQVSVKEGSMIPKDPVTKANQAIDLSRANLLDPISLYDALEFPNPQQSAERLFTWQNAPQLLFPEVAQGVGTAQAEQELEQAATQQAINEEEQANLPLLDGTNQTQGT